jgi:hypothetical protein
LNPKMLHTVEAWRYAIQLRSGIDAQPCAVTISITQSVSSRSRVILGNTRMRLT